MKANKQKSLQRKKTINANKPQLRPAKGQDSRSVHDAKGRNNHGRTRW